MTAPNVAAMKHLVRVVSVCVLGAFGGVVLAAPVGASVAAKAAKSCKVLKQTEIERVMGQPTAKGTKGLTTRISGTCNWEVAATADLPEGTVSVHLQTFGADVAYETNSELPDVEKVPELGKAYYDPRTGALTLLKGSKLVTVQAVFIQIDGGIGQVDRKDECIELMKLAKKRV
jgi:hypothetical protein